MNAAVAALLGILLGGLTATTTALFQWRRDVADKRQPRRLVAEELRTHILQYHPMIEHAQWPNFGTGGFFPVHEWSKRGAVLARHLSQDVWNHLAAYMASIAALRSLMANEPPGSSISKDSVDKLRMGLRLASQLFIELTGRPANQL